MVDAAAGTRAGEAEDAPAITGRNPPLHTAATATATAENLAGRGRARNALTDATIAGAPMAPSSTAPAQWTEHGERVGVATVFLDGGGARGAQDET